MEDEEERTLGAKITMYILFPSLNSAKQLDTGGKQICALSPTELEGVSKSLWAAGGPQQVGLSCKPIAWWERMLSFPAGQL